MRTRRAEEGLQVSEHHRLGHPSGATSELEVTDRLWSNLRFCCLASRSGLRTVRWDIEKVRIGLQIGRF
jgi:hypothetical protein